MFSIYSGGRRQSVHGGVNRKIFNGLNHAGKKQTTFDVKSR